MSDCNFDNGITATFKDGVMIEMPDSVTIKGVTIDAGVSYRGLNQNQIQGGKKVTVNATVECLKVDFLSTGANLLGGDVVTFSDGREGKITSIDDFNADVLTITVGSTLAGSAGPNDGRW